MLFSLLFRHFIKSALELLNQNKQIKNPTEITTQMVNFYDDSSFTFTLEMDLLGEVSLQTVLPNLLP